MQRRHFTLAAMGSTAPFLLLATTQAHALSLADLSNADASSGLKGALEQGACAAFYCSIDVACVSKCYTAAA